MKTLSTTFMIALENGIERKKIIYISDIMIMVLKDMFLYVIRIYAILVVVLRCKQFTDWLTQDVNNSGTSYLLLPLMCVGNCHGNSSFQTIQVCYKSFVSVSY